MDKKSSFSPHSGHGERPHCATLDRVEGVKSMLRFKALLIAAPVAAGLLMAPAAHAEWRGRGGERHDNFRHERHGGPGVGGVILGLGAAAVLGGVLASQAYAAPPPVYYAPPPAYYPPPPAYYAPPAAYYAPPPAYYPRGY
jgi:hypothetical protein